MTLVGLAQLEQDRRRSAMTRTDYPNKTVGTGANRDRSACPSTAGTTARTRTTTPTATASSPRPRCIVDRGLRATGGYSLPRDIVSVSERLRSSRTASCASTRCSTTRADTRCSTTRRTFSARSRTRALARRSSTRRWRSRRANIAKRNSNPSSAAGFLESGQFWRFRELSGTLLLPSRLAAQRCARATWR